MYHKLKHWLNNLSSSLNEAVQQFKDYTEEKVIEPRYELMIIDKVTRSTSKKKFFQIKEAIDHVTPEILFDKKHDYLLFNTADPAAPFIKLNKSHESNSNTRVVQARQTPNKKFYPKRSHKVGSRP